MMRVAVYGLWHLGCVTAACLAGAGNQVIGLDDDAAVVRDLQAGTPPLYEPGLAELIADGLAAGALSFTTDARDALRDAEAVWVTFDTPVNERDEADVAAVRAHLDAIADAIAPGTIMLISSQVPVGFTGALARDWAARGLRYAYSPENLRLGKALDVFRHPERVVIGIAPSDDATQAQLAALFAPFSEHIVWMSVASGEMTKHALNAFLATSVTFINEIARVCEAVGADATEVERGLKSEGRIGPRAYLSPGGAFAGGTLARDVRFLIAMGQETQVQTPLLAGVLESNAVHTGWLHERTRALLAAISAPTVAVIGLTYKPDTSTLRRSSAVEFCHWLVGAGVHVRAHDPTVEAHPPELPAAVTVCATPGDALLGADLAVLGTAWVVYRSLTGDDFARAMRHPQVIDQNGFLAAALAADDRLTYIATGRVHHAAGH